MKKVDFKNFPIREKISSEKVKRQDMSEDIANAIYRNAAGIKGLDLAMKIYKSDGVIELNDDEWEIVLSVANVALIPAVMETLLNIGKDVKYGSEDS